MRHEFRLNANEMRENEEKCRDENKQLKYEKSDFMPLWIKLDF